MIKLRDKNGIFVEFKEEELIILLMHGIGLTSKLLSEESKKVNSPDLVKSRMSLDSRKNILKKIRPEHLIVEMV